MLVYWLYVWVVLLGWMFGLYGYLLFCFVGFVLFCFGGFWFGLGVDLYSGLLLTFCQVVCCARCLLVGWVDVCDCDFVVCWHDVSLGLIVF